MKLPNPKKNWFQYLAVIFSGGAIYLFRESPEIVGHILGFLFWVFVLTMVIRRLKKNADKQGELHSGKVSGKTQLQRETPRSRSLAKKQELSLYG